MSLKVKTAFIVILSFLILLTLIGLVVRFSVLPSFQQIENNIVIEHTLQTKNGILDELADINNIVGDWAGWRDTRDFALGDYPEYIDDNMMNASYTTLEVNFMWIGDADGHELFAKDVDLDSGAETAFSDNLREYIADHPRLTHFSTVTDSMTCIVNLPDGLVMLASQPIRDSNNTGTIAGSLIMGKYLDSRWLQILAEKTRLTVATYRWDDPALPAPIQAAKDGWQDTEAVKTYIVNDDTIVGLTAINDIDGHPAGIVTVEQPRIIFRAGWNSLSVFFGATTVIAVLMVLVMVILLDQMVLKRVTDLGAHLTQITRSGDLSQRLAVRGTDELSELMQTLNGMMDTIQTSDEALRAAHDTLEQRVSERTSALSVALSEKNALLKEVHHRVKNNLQIITSLLNLQARGVDDPNTLALLHDSQSRVRSMALVHEKLYQSEALDRINFKNYLQDLVGYLYRLYWHRDGRVEFLVQAENIELSIDTAVPCGLLVNELITNSLKHAFPDGTDGGKVEVRFWAEENGYKMVVADNGVGLPPEFDMQQNSSLGIQLIKSLTRQLDGNVVISAKEGVSVTISFPNGKESV